MGNVWGLGKRKFKGDWGRRLWLFDRLVWVAVSYGVVIWGWKEREGIERLQEKYLKWLLGVSRHTPGYLMREELQRDLLKGKVEVREWKYEKRLGEGKGGVLARECWVEMRRRAGRGEALGVWEEERKSYWEMRGWSIEEVEGRREGREIRGEEIISREGRLQREERWEKIGGTRYNKWYGLVKEKGIPGYLRKG